MERDTSDGREPGVLRLYELGGTPAIAPLREVVGREWAEAPFADVVTLWGNIDAHQREWQGWSRACRLQGFHLAWSEDLSEWDDEPNIPERVAVVVILGAAGARLQVVSRISQLGSHTLVVTPVDGVEPIPIHVEGRLRVHRGEEGTLLGWYRKRPTHWRQLPATRAQLNVTERTLALERECFPLQPRETQLLLLLAQAASVCSFGYICAELWGHDDESKRRQLRQYVYQLRQKLGRHGGLIQYVRGVGYHCFLALEVVSVA